MKLIADLHLHSKYSRAVSPQMVPQEIVRWAKLKGINLVGTADWTHPLWFRELKSNLKEVSQGIFQLATDNPQSQDQDEIYFLLSTEISSIYSQGGKCRRIHNLVLAPSFSTVEKINQSLLGRGANLLSDGRPIIGLSAKDLVELVLGIDKECLIIPAHCLLPNESLHTNKNLKAIKKIKVGDKVYTHRNRWRKVTKVIKRPFLGKAYLITSDYFRIGIKVTNEHPFYAIKTKKNCPSVNINFGICKPLCSQAKKGCARKYYDKYQPEWVRADKLEKGDVLLYPRFTRTKKKNLIKISNYLKSFKGDKNNLVSPGGKRRHLIPNIIKINRDFCRLAGWYLAEGYTTRGLISFCFNENEINIIKKIERIIKETFGIEKFREYKRKSYKAIELTFYSKILHLFFSGFFYQNPKRRKANHKCLPNWMLELPLCLQKEIFISWWQGDKGYTTSRLLMNQMKIICLRLGIIPSIGIDRKKDHQRRKHDKFENRIIKALHDTYHFSYLSFFEDKFKLRKRIIFKKYLIKIQRRRGWIDKDFVYLPIRKIEQFDFQGKVYNLEVENDQSYTAEFACVHNCWTPWFSLYGSQSGFDSIDECFGNLAKFIYGIETGLSSSPEMNWRIKELDNRTILSFSDAHSPAKLGREATIFKNKSDNSKLKISYQDISKAIKKDPTGNWEVASTIEFYPEEGKYHWTGHRNCSVKQSPEETQKLGAACPVCGKSLTIGVMHRVEDLASSSCQVLKKEKDGLVINFHPENKQPPYVMLIPLMEILSECLKSGTSSKGVINEFQKLVSYFKSEFDLLLKTDLGEIQKIAGERISQAIGKVRKGDIFIDPGYDGVFGKVKIWKDENLKQEEKKQMSLF